MTAPALAPPVPPAATALRIARSCVGGVALTFDDGTHRLGTPAVLRVLARAQATATFFVVGEQVDRRPALLREIAAAGHDIGVHGFRHRCQLRQTASARSAWTASPHDPLRRAHRRAVARAPRRPLGRGLKQTSGSRPSATSGLLPMTSPATTNGRAAAWSSRPRPRLAVFGASTAPTDGVGTAWIDSLLPAPAMGPGPRA